MGEGIATINDVAKALAVHPDTVRREIARGRLTAFRVGRKLRIRWESVEAYVLETSVVPTAISAVRPGGRISRTSGDSLSARQTKLRPSEALPLPSETLRKRLGLAEARPRSPR